MPTLKVFRSELHLGLYHTYFEHATYSVHKLLDG